MGWTLPKHEVLTFIRNPLAAVIVQMRFHPILKIAEHFADFQERVRPRFPGYESVEGQTVEWGGAGGVQVRRERSHRFPAEAEPSALSLSTSAFSIEYSAHRDRSVLMDDVDRVTSALAELYAPVVPLRLGLRYVNVVSRERMSAELGRQVTWRDLLTESFSLVPGAGATLDGATSFAVEVSAPCSAGRMTVRHAVLPDPPNVQQFRLDTDRFIEGSFKLDDVRPLLTGFSEDIFQVFMTAAGPALLEWMSAENERGAP